MVSSVGPDVEIGWVAATVLREHTGTEAPVQLPSPPPGVVRLWMKNSWFNPRVLDAELTDRLTAVVEWPRDYVDVAEDDVLMAGGRPEVLDDPTAVLRLVVAHRLARRPRMVHRTFAVEQGVPGDDFELWEEFDGVEGALERFGELLEDAARETELTEDEHWLLKVNGLLGLAFTEQGRQILGKIREAVRLGLLSQPVQYGEYTKAVKDPLDEGEASALVSLGVLCSKCPGMTWGEVGYELARGIGGG